MFIRFLIASRLGRAALFINFTPFYHDYYWHDNFIDYSIISSHKIDASHYLRAYFITEFIALAIYFLYMLYLSMPLLTHSDRFLDADIWFTPRFFTIASLLHTQFHELYFYRLHMNLYYYTPKLLPSHIYYWCYLSVSFWQHHIYNISDARLMKLMINTITPLNIDYFAYNKLLL